MDQNGRPYPSDLTDWQWEIIREHIPVARSGGRRRTTDIRKVINAIFYLNRTGMAWRYLPKNFPPWQTVYDYFSKWNQSGVWEFLNRVLNQALRIRLKKSSLPTLGIVDSQSVRAHLGEEKGWDGFKKVRGRKRHILVDSLGMLLACDVQSANLRDPQGGVKVLEKIPKAISESLQVILGDAAYVGPFDDVAWVEHHIKVERTKTYQEAGTTLYPKRWIVERTFAWFNHFRRLSRDYERKTLNSESMIYISMITLMLKRLSS